MNSQEIENILEKYFNGDTTPDEEKKLKTFFSGNKMPSHFKSLKSYFNYFAEEEKTILSDDFDNKIINSIQESEIRSTKSKRKIYLYIASGIAACILIVIGIFAGFNRITKEIKDTYKNPEVAYRETKKALIYFSAKFNSGLEAAEPITDFESGVKQMNKINKLNKGLKEAIKLSTFYAIQKEIMKN